MSKDSSKRKRLHGTSCTKAKANCTQLIAIVYYVQFLQPAFCNSWCSGSCFFHCCNGYLCLQNSIEWHQRLVLTEKIFTPRFSPGENTSLYWQCYQILFFTTHIKEKNESGSRDYLLTSSHTNTHTYIHTHTLQLKVLKDCSTKRILYLFYPDLIKKHALVKLVMLNPLAFLVLLYSKVSNHILKFILYTCMHVWNIKISNSYSETCQSGHLAIKIPA